MPRFETFFRNTKELGLVLGIVLILIVLFAPIPPMMLDLAIVVNFGLALTILLLTLYVTKPVEFSTFPSLLLVSTLFRLSINVAATRLILAEAGAGEVINSIGTFAVGGNFIVGLVVFFILVVVQYVVVTSGAQRVSEVAARFMLDAMPGQQMSIDADLNMGLIDQKEAVRRRSALEREASFYGAMDGASKFVKGDAIAGMIILLINIVAGWAIGVMQMGMAWDEALHRFTLLTIGDGIATQLPALIIAIATGIIVTRSSADRELSTEVFRQLSSMPRILLIVACILGLLLLLPGMPKWPIILLIAATLLTWRRIYRAAANAAPDSTAEPAEEARAGGVPALSVALGRELGEAWRPKQTLLLERIAVLRDSHERALGLAFPAVKIVDDAQLGGAEYEIRLFGTRYAGGEIEPEKVLAIRSERVTRTIAGQATIDPAFGLPALWIDAPRQAEAREAGYTIVDPVTVFITHLGELLRTEAPALLSRSAVAELLDQVRARQGGVVEELASVLTISDVQRVLQNLLAEGASIAAIDLIVEHLVDIARTEKDASNLTEAVRQRMSYVICNKLKDRHQDLSVLSLDPRLENQIQANVAASGRRDGLVLEPRLSERLIRQLAAHANEMIRRGREPVLLCGADIRRQMRLLTRRAIPKLSVLSVAEIPTHIELSSFAVVKLEDPAAKPVSPTQRDMPGVEGAAFEGSF